MSVSDDPSNVWDLYLVYSKVGGWDRSTASDPEFNLCARFLDTGCVVRFGKRYYLYDIGLRVWFPLRSDRSYRMIADVCGGGNATVNYAKVAEPYMAWLESLSIRLGEVDRSVCIAGQRYTVETGRADKSCYVHIMGNNYLSVSANSDYFVLRDYTPYEASFPQNALKAMFVTESPSHGTVIRAHTGNIDRYVFNYMSNTMGEDELRCLMWICGNCITDPVRSAYVAFILGTEGGEGKSTIINMVSECFEGVAHPRNLNFMGSSGTAIPDGLLQTFAASRLIVHGDLTFKKYINVAGWKAITGGDIMHLAGGGKAESFCSILLASNDIFSPWDAGYNRWFTRRTVVLGMKPIEIGPKATPRQTLTDTSKSAFVIECVRIRYKYDIMPVTTRIALRTILGTQMKIATRCIIYEPDATFAEAYGAMVAICVLSRGLDISRLIMLVESMNPGLVVMDERYQTKYILGVKLNTGLSDD